MFYGRMKNLTGVALTKVYLNITQIYVHRNSETIFLAVQMWNTFNSFFITRDIYMFPQPGRGRILEECKSVP
jgi:hypothetical protein